MDRRANLDGTTWCLFRPEVEIDGTPTRILVEQLTVVDPEVRLGPFAGRLTTAELAALGEALRAALSLD